MGTKWVPGQEPLPQSVALAPTLSPRPTLPFLVKKQLKTDLTLKTKKPMNGVGKRKQLSGFIIKNRLIKFETEYNVGSFFFVFCVLFCFCGFLRFFTPVWWSHQQTSNKDMPTMFHYTATVTHYPQRSGSCCPMTRGLHHFRDKQCHCLEEEN